MAELVRGDYVTPVGKNPDVARLLGITGRVIEVFHSQHRGHIAVVHFDHDSLGQFDLSWNDLEKVNS